MCIVQKPQRVSRIWIIGIVLLVLAGSAAARPAWIDQGGDPALEREALQGVGSCTATGDPAADRRRAADAARTEIASQIRVDIKSIFTTETHEIDGEVSSRIAEQTESFVRLSLSGIKIRRRHFDKKEEVYYAWAVLDREQSLRQWRPEDTVHLKAAEQARDRFLKAQEGNAFLEGIRVGAEWTRHAMKAASLEQLCSAVALEPALKWPGAYLLSEAIGGLRAFLQDMDMSPQGNLPTGVFGASLPESVRAVLWYKGYPIPEVPVRFRFLRGRGLFSKGEQITVKTDAQGIALCRVVEIRSVTDRNIVAAAPDTIGWGLPTGVPLPQCEIVFSSVLHPTARTEGLYFSLEGSSSEQTFRDGQEIQFTATSNRDGALHLFLIDAAGRLKYLTSKELDHPEATRSWNIERYGTGWRFSFPMVLRASSGRGLETLVGLWTVPGIRIGQPGQVYVPSELWEQAGQEAGPGRWGVHTLSYEIE